MSAHLSKAEELAILRAAAKKLGHDSYLGPALESLLPHVEQEMRSDFMPDLLGLVAGLERRAADLTLAVRDMEKKLADLQRDVQSNQALAYSAECKLAGFRRKAAEMAADLNVLAGH
jgi:hypothetical protein